MHGILSHGVQAPWPTASQQAPPDMQSEHSVERLGPRSRTSLNKVLHPNMQDLPLVMVAGNRHSQRGVQDAGLGVMDLTLAGDVAGGFLPFTSPHHNVKARL